MSADGHGTTDFQGWMEKKVPLQLRVDICDYIFESSNSMASQKPDPLGDWGEWGDTADDWDMEDDTFCPLPPLQLRRLMLDDKTGRLTRLPFCNQVWQGEGVFAQTLCPLPLEQEYLEYILRRHWFRFDKPEHLFHFAQEVKTRSICVPVQVSADVYAPSIDGDRWMKAICELPRPSTVHLYINAKLHPEDLPMLQLIVRKMKRARHTVIADAEDQVFALSIYNTVEGESSGWSVLGEVDDDV